MAAPASHSGDPRDEWMRRLGPLYPAMVALGCLTRVPLPRGLTPAHEDLPRSAMWFPIAGAAVGALMAGVVELGLAVHLVPAIAGALGLLAGLALTGGMLERGLAQAIERTGERAGKYAPAGERERQLGGVLAVGALVALRGLGLLGAAIETWLAALVLAPMIARWCALALTQVGPWLGLEVPAPERARATLVPAGATAASVAMASAITLVVALWLGRGAGLLAMLVGALAHGIALWLAHRDARGVSVKNLTAHGLAAAAAASELAVLLVFAAAHPAVLSPWIAALP